MKRQIIRISKRDGTEQVTTQAELKKVVNGYYERFEDAMHVLESGLRIQSLGYYYELRPPVYGYGGDKNGGPGADAPVCESCGDPIDEKAPNPVTDGVPIFCSSCWAFDPPVSQEKWSMASGRKFGKSYATRKEVE